VIVVVDESVSFAVVEALRHLGHEVTAMAEEPHAGLVDRAVYEQTVGRDALLITRDHHFTNTLRYPPQHTAAIIYIRRGNLRSEEEAALVVRLFDRHDLSLYKGNLITLYQNEFRIQDPLLGSTIESL